jgi:hypothetical protein
MRTPRPLPEFTFRDANYPTLTASELQTAGMTPAAIRTAVADGRLIRVARAVYAVGARLDDDGWNTLRIRTDAFLRTAPPGAIAAGWSAVALHRRLPTMTTPPPKPSVIRLRAGVHGSDRTPWGHTRYCLVPDDCVTEVDGLSVLNPGFTVCDLVRSTGPLSSLMADFVARTPLGREQIVRAEQALRHWPGYPRSAWLARHCDGLSESPLETAGRYAVLKSGLPMPVSNAWLGAGWPDARVDHWWAEQALAAEGDGAVKYAQDAAAVIAAEKHRQWGLEVLGVAFVRYDWDLAVRRPALLAARFGAALASASAPVSADLRWWTCQEGWALRRGEANLDRYPGRPVRRQALLVSGLAS